MKNNKRYDAFIRSGRNAMFTDEQIDFLWENRLRTQSYLDMVVFSVITFSAAFLFVWLVNKLGL
jgi:hypothetical protein